MLDELADDEGGRWVVETETSQLLFDLDAMTVTRLTPAGGRLQSANRPQPLEGIGVCKAGFCCYWLMRSNSVGKVRYSWRCSTPVVSITPEPASQ